MYSMMNSISLLTVASDHSGVGGTMLSRRGTATSQIGFRDSSNGQLMIQAPGHNALFGPTGLHDGEWHHLAWVRNGMGSNNIKCYVDGVQQLQYSNTAPWFNVTSPLYIGSYGAMESFGGKLDEIRMSDSARYTSAFTPSTTAFTSDSNTVVLIQSDTTDGSTVFTDSSSNGYGITVTNVNHINATQPVGSSAIKFDGTGDYLSLPKEDKWQFLNDFTIEAWVYYNDITERGSIFSTSQADSQHAQIGILFELADAGKITWQGRTESTNSQFIQSSVLNNNQWYHVAAVRSGTASNNIKIYVDGVALGTTNTQVGKMAFPDTLLKIGKSHTTQHEMNGYMDEYRVSNIARYTSNFTPSTTKFVADNQTLLLIHSDDVNNSVTFTSDEVKTNIIAPVNDAKHSNNVAKIGYSGIGGFDGSSFLSVPDHADWEFGTNDFTVEFWVQLDSVGGDFLILDHRANSSNDGGFAIFADVSDFGIGIDYASSTTNWASGIHTASIETVGVWYHFAVVQDIKLGLLSVFRDGVSHVSSSRLTDDVNGTYMGWLIGGNYNSS